MLDSPDGGPEGSLLEEFFEIYIEGKQEGMAEDKARRVLSERHGLTFQEATRKLYGQAWEEQQKGQKGLTKAEGRSGGRAARLPPPYITAVEYNFLERSSL